MPNPTKSEVAQALKHPLRRALLPVFLENRPLSATEAARLIGATLSDVSYHVRVLVEYEFLVLHSTEDIRGAKKSFYLPNDEILGSPIVKEFLAKDT